MPTRDAMNRKPSYSVNGKRMGRPVKVEGERAQMNFYTNEATLARIRRYQHREELESAQDALRDLVALALDAVEAIK